MARQALGGTRIPTPYPFFQPRSKFMFHGRLFVLLFRHDMQYTQVLNKKQLCMPEEKLMPHERADSCRMKSACMLTTISHCASLFGSHTYSMS